MRHVGTLERFNKEMDAFSAALTMVQLPLFQKKIVFDAFRLIVDKTPVDTGRARGGWQVTVGSPAENETGLVGEPPMPDLSELGPFDVAYISNNVPYIIFLEDGTSTQAPLGMIAETFEELIQIFPGGN